MFPGFQKNKIIFKKRREPDILFKLLASSVDLAEVRAVLQNIILKNEGVSIHTELLQVPVPSKKKKRKFGFYLI